MEPTTASFIAGAVSGLSVGAIAGILVATHYWMKACDDITSIWKQACAETAAMWRKAYEEKK